MANITCPQCSRFVDDSAKFCPGCKYNIKKYVKEMKKKGGTVSGSISFGSVYSKTSAGTDAVPELEFLKPARPSADKPVPQPEAVEPAYEEPAIQTYEPEAAPAAPAYQEPAAASYSVSEPPVVPTYEETAPAATENRGVSTVDPRTLFPKDTIPTFRPAYKPRVLASAPAYDPNYKKHEEAAAEPVRPAYEEAPAAPAAPVYETPAPAPAPVPAAPVMPAAVTPAAPAAPAYQPAAPAYQPAAPAAPAAAAPAPAIPPEALLYQQPAAPAYQPAAPAAAAPAPAIPPEALLYQQPAAPAYQPAAPAYQPAAPAYQPAAPAYQPAAPAYQQPAAPARAAGNYQPARAIQTASAPAAYAQRQQPAPAVTGVFESAALNCGVGGGGALSGEVSGPTILEKLRAEEEERKANASIFESPNLRAAEKELKNGTRQPAGGLHGEISFDNYATPERGSFGQATAYQIQQAAYVAAGAAGSGQSSVPPYAVQPGAGPGGMAYQIPSSGASPAYAQQAAAPAYAPAPNQAQSVPAFAAGPGMGNPYAPVNGAIPYITQTPAGSGNPILGGGGANPMLGGGNANPLLGGGT